MVGAMSDRELSPSCLSFLFADRLITRIGWPQRMWGRYLVEVPSSGSMVRLGELERQLLSVALWNLNRSSCRRRSKTARFCRSKSARCRCWLSLGV